MNFFDQPAKVLPSEPPPATSEGEYGANVVSLPRRKSKQGQPGWKDDWHVSPSGVPLPTFHNAMLALRNLPSLANVLRYDQMARSAIVVDQIPGTAHDSSIPRELTDEDVLSIQEEMQRTGLRRISKETARDAVELRAREGKFHPVHDYLNALVWDGETRVGGWLARYLGAEGGPYADAIGQMFLVAMVARQFDPGCQADYMLILEGPQGARKSTACRTLAGGWFSDNLPNLSKGDAIRLSMHLRGKWLIEIAEMSSFNSAETHTLKEFLTQTEERYTPKYGRNEVKEKRQCLFIGTTNEGVYLRDATGARRFWPVKVGEIDIDALAADRDQLFAEAVTLYRAGAPWHPNPAFEKEHIVPQQAARFVEDTWQEDILQWVARENIERCTVNEILKGALSLQPIHIGTREQRRVSDIMRHIGWIMKRIGGKGYYMRPERV